MIYIQPLVRGMGTFATINLRLIYTLRDWTRVQTDPTDYSRGFDNIRLPRYTYKPG